MKYTKMKFKRESSLILSYIFWIKIKFWRGNRLIPQGKVSVFPGLRVLATLLKAISSYPDYEEGINKAHHISLT